MRVGTFNVLADKYIHYGDSLPPDSELQAPGSRIELLQTLINSLGVDVLALQEVDDVLAKSINRDGAWQTFWRQKDNNKPDGCLTLVHPDIAVDSSEMLAFGDKSGHVAQIIQLGGIAVVNTHLKWSPTDDPQHKGLGQVRELLGEQPAIILADCNDQPGGPVRRRLTEAGFGDLVGKMPTAWISGEAVSIDTIALRGVAGRLVPTLYSPAKPNRQVPSDHIPVLADVE